jgi:1-hydroxycarotenoid 3,4-desaturase
MAPSIVVVGAGVGGLAAAIELAKHGVVVTLVDRAPRIGGKLRAVELRGQRLDAGPTVLTLTEVLEAIFDGTGVPLDRAVRLRRSEMLARHVFADGAVLDLFADLERSAAAIARFAGPEQAEGYLAFSRFAERIYETVRDVFLLADRPGLGSVLRRGPAALWRLARIDPRRSLASALGTFFSDPRLVQLFGRYATYVGSSPFAAPATLAVIAHVERLGVWSVEGGLHTLAEALGERARALGVRVQCGVEVEAVEVRSRRVRGVRLKGGERLAAGAVVLNVDVGALASGLLGDDLRREAPVGTRSMSAVTWHVVGRCRGLPLVRHNVLFSGDYRREFAEIFDRHALPSDPTLYICAQDRDDIGPPGQDHERLLILANAPAGPVRQPDIEALSARMRGRLESAGLAITDSSWTLTTPRDFARLFPGSEGALYGAAQHHWTSFFSRPGARTRVRGLYLAGGGTHPGPGVPMAAQSGRLAAAAVAQDLGLAA